MNSIEKLEMHKQAVDNLDNHKANARKKIPNYRDKARLEAKCAEAKKALDDAMLQAGQIGRATRSKEAASKRQRSAIASCVETPDRGGQIATAPVAHFSSATNYGLAGSPIGQFPPRGITYQAAAEPATGARGAVVPDVLPSVTNTSPIRTSTHSTQSDEPEGPRGAGAPYEANSSSNGCSQGAAKHTAGAFCGFIHDQRDDVPGERHESAASETRAARVPATQEGCAPASLKTPSALATTTPVLFDQHLPRFPTSASHAPAGGNESNATVLLSAITPPALRLPSQTTAVAESSAHIGRRGLIEGARINVSKNCAHSFGQPMHYKRYPSMTASYKPPQMNMESEISATPSFGVPIRTVSGTRVGARFPKTNGTNLHPPYDRSLVHGKHQEAPKFVDPPREMISMQPEGLYPIRRSFSERHSNATVGRGNSNSALTDGEKSGQQDESMVRMPGTPSKTEDKHALSAGQQSFAYPSSFRSPSSMVDRLARSSGPNAGNVHPNVLTIQADQHLMSPPAAGKVEGYPFQQPDSRYTAGTSFIANRDTRSDFSSLAPDSGQEDTLAGQQSSTGLAAANWQTPGAHYFTAPFQPSGFDMANILAEPEALQGQYQGSASDVNEFTGDSVAFDWHSQTLTSSAFSPEDFAGLDDVESTFEPIDYSATSSAPVVHALQPQCVPSAEDVESQPIRHGCTPNGSAATTDNVVDGQKLLEAGQNISQLKGKIADLHKTVQVEQASLLELEGTYNSRTMDFRSTLDKAFQIRKTLEAHESQMMSLSSELQDAEEAFSVLDQHARDIERRDALKAEDMKFVKVIEDNPGLPDDTFRQLKAQRLRILDELVEITNRLQQSSPAAERLNKSGNYVANDKVVDPPPNIPADIAPNDSKKRKGHAMLRDPVQKKRRLRSRSPSRLTGRDEGDMEEGSSRLVGAIQSDLGPREIVYRVLGPDADVPTRGGRMTASRLDRLADKIKAKEQSQRKPRKPRPLNEEEKHRILWGQGLPFDDSPMEGLTAEEYRELEMEGSAQLNDFLQTGDVRKIDVTIRRLAREYQVFLPESSDQTRELAMAIHYTEAENHQCRYHRTNRGRKESDGTGKYKVEGIAYQADLASKKFHDHHMHCGCAIDDVLLEYYFWKRWKIRSRNPEVSDEEGMRDLIITPRHRAFIVQSFQFYTLLGIEDIYQWSSSPTKSHPLHVHLSIVSILRQARALKRKGYDIDWLALTSDDQSI